LILVVYFGMEPLKEFPYADDVRAQVKVFLKQTPTVAK
jgi:hypothetical protein